MKGIVYPILAILFASIALSSGQAVSARWVMEKNNEQNRTSDVQSEFVMKLINRRGDTKTRRVVLYAKTNKQHDDKTLIRFLSPADVRGVGLLSRDVDGREHQWLYLPALQRERRISSSQKTDSFMGSDFSYEDLQSGELDEYEYSLMGEESLNGMDCYIIQSVPVNELTKKETAYSRLELWIAKEHHLAIRVNFYDRQDALMKTMSVSDIRQVEGSAKWRGHLVEMRDVKTGHRTELHYEIITIDQGLDDDLFSLRYLTSGK